MFLSIKTKNNAGKYLLELAELYVSAYVHPVRWAQTQAHCMESGHVWQSQDSLTGVQRYMGITILAIMMQAPKGNDDGTAIVAAPNLTSPN